MQQNGKNRFPPAIYYIIGNEAAERFCYYGLRAILTIFLVTHFYNPTVNPALQAAAEAKANEQTHFFITLSYFMPIIGALLADWFFGKYFIIFWLSLVYCVGNFLMAFFLDSYPVFMTGLVLIAVGAGGIKPCVSANVGDQFDKTDTKLINRAFSWFYLSINFGSFFSTLLTPLILKYYGAKIAFGVPGILMLLATILFFAGRKKYVRVPPSGFPKEHFLGLNFYVLKNLYKKVKGQSLLNIALDKYSQKSVDAAKSVWKVLALFSFIPVFWMLYDQNSSEWVIQATRLNLNFLGVNFLAQQVQAVNPILILVFTPLFTNVIYPSIEKTGFNFTPHRKILAGFIFIAISFSIIYALQLQVDAGNKPSVGWQFLAYMVLTVAEILVYLTGLEYAYAQAPASMKSTVMSFWLLTLSVGNLLVSLINRSIASGGFLARLTGATYYLFFIGLLVAIAILFVVSFFKPLFNKQTIIAIK